MQLVAEFRFAAAHEIATGRGLCEGLHGHNYRLVVTIEGRYDPATGTAGDHAALRCAFDERVYAPLDHRLLNDHVPNPTGENVVRWIWRQLGGRVEGLRELRLHEEDDRAVVYRGD
jgi:6-pyruvoyltetrahydropterin/6-carboxytetrahydropterin synthase